ncbi:MAG: archaetidylserine decarboxylase [Myxococcota bacterium]
MRILPRKRLSRVLGRVADLHGPQALVDGAVRAFSRVYGVDLSEAQVPEGGFSSFDAFFTRRLRPGARPVDPDPTAVVSPADGRVEDRGGVDPHARLRVKGRTYSVAELLGDADAALRYAGGHFFIVYLSPRDYHRVHAPVSGAVELVRHVPGTLWPVNAIGLEHVPNLFARNERVAVLQRSEHHGAVTTVLVGAMGVGRIGLSFDDLRTNAGQTIAPLRRYAGAEPELDRGAELGVFHLGSTVIVFLERGVGVRFHKAPGDVVRMGEAVARGGAR